MGRAASIQVAAVAALAAVLSSDPASAQPGTADGSGGRIVEVLHNPPGEVPILGPRYAPVTIEFFLDIRDYNRSLNVHRHLRMLAERHPLRLRILYRVVNKGHPRSEKAYEAALEAFAQGRFHRFLETYYATYRRGDSELEKIAGDAGVDFKRITEAWEDQRHRETVVANHYRLRRFGLSGAPSILINGVPLPTPPTSLDDFEERYDAAYAEAKVQLADGVPMRDLYRRILTARLAGREVPRVAIGRVDGERLAKETLAMDNGFSISGPVDYSGPHSRGSEDAVAVAVLYCSAFSNWCPTMVRQLSDLVAAYPRELRVVVKLVSLTEEGEASDRIDRVHAAVECAGAQGEFWDFFGRVLSQGRGIQDLDEYLVKAAESSTLNIDRWKRCRDSSATRAKLAAQRSEALASGVTRTPTIVIGGRLYIGAINELELAALVELELAPGLLGSWPLIAID